MMTNNNRANRTATLESFATGMRAASLVHDLAKEGIMADTFQAKWTNKRLPPPRIEVRIDPADMEKAEGVLAFFKVAGTRL